MTPLAAFVFLLFAYSASGTTEAGNKTSTTDGLSPKILERLSRYETSIRYWDTPNLEFRKEILKQLAEDQVIKIPGCPRIRYPIICADDGVLLENVCYFKMRRRERSGVLPVMVFTSTPIDQARAMCDKEIRKP